MKSAWYLVKQNWPQTAARCPSYAGLGGNVWPLDEARDAAASAVHARMLGARWHVPLGVHEELLCTDLGVAEEYFKAASERLQNVWLLRVTAAEQGQPDPTGFDAGFASGGFSVVETELITQALDGPKRNDHGLFSTMDDVTRYMAAREENEDLEQLDGIRPVSIRILRQS